MKLNRSVLAAGILLLSGFAGGFSLSKGSGQVLGIKPLHKVHEKGSGAGSNMDEVLAVGIMNAAGGDGTGGGGGIHPRLNTGGIGGGDGGPEGSTGMAGGDGASRAGIGTTSAAGVPAGATRVAPTTLTGSVTVPFLAGNTVDATLSGAGETRLIYFAARGLRGDGNEHGFLVTPWSGTRNATCEPGSDGALVCRPSEVRAEPGEHQERERIGTMRLGRDRWVPVYKGNIAGFPDRIPAIDSTLVAAEPGAGAGIPVLKGQQALDALVGHAAAIVRDAGSQDRQPDTILLAKGGREISLARPRDSTDLSSGIVVKLDRWTFAKDALCLSSRGSVPGCYQLELRGSTLLLLPTSGKTPIRVEIMTDTPTKVEARN